MSMPWQQLESTLADIAHSLGYAIAQEHKTGDKWIDVAGSVNLTDLAKRMADYVEPATKPRKVRSQNDQT
jgi:hypothetical protein